MPPWRGLIRKQKGIWRVTRLGRHVLAQSDDPEDLLEITRSALSYAEKHRAGYQYAAKILETAWPWTTWLRWLTLTRTDSRSGCAHQI